MVPGGRPSRSPALLEQLSQVVGGLASFSLRVEVPMMRIVIAHRLSTIMHADRIDVLVGGRIAQSGVYEKLLAEPGRSRS
jgi:ABC-type microcin C transport system duplicated ATPase subunit YejF